MPKKMCQVPAVQFAVASNNATGNPQQAQSSPDLVLRESTGSAPDVAPAVAPGAGSTSPSSSSPVAPALPPGQQPPPPVVPGWSWSHLDDYEGMAYMIQRQYCRDRADGGKLRLAD